MNNKSILRLMAGFRRFRVKYFLEDAAESSIYHRLSSIGQTPKTLLIGCSDSRVDPAIMTGASPGELFVVRNVANLVPPCEPATVGFHGTSSAIEFAVMDLKVENVIILGHSQCGGIRALMQGPDKTHGFTTQWMSIAHEAREQVLAEAEVIPPADEMELRRRAEMASLKISLKNLRTFPFVREAVETRQMNVIGVYFDLERGHLWEYDDSTGNFRRLEL